MNGSMINLLMSSMGMTKEDIEQIGDVGKQVSQLPIKLDRIERKLNAIILHFDVPYVEPVEDDDEETLLLIE